VAQRNGTVKGGADVIARLADDVLPTLAARLEASKLGEIEVGQDGWRVRLRRNTPLADGADHGTAAPAAKTSRKPDRPTNERPADAATDRAVGIKSPAVGYFIPRDGVTVGSNLRSGDLVGHVDVLGVRQDVVAPDDGRLTAVEAESGQAVEYGEQLARMERAR
jgi:biotin carboxyl carrier protein